MYKKEFFLHVRNSLNLGTVLKSWNPGTVRGRPSWMRAQRISLQEPKDFISFRVRTSKLKCTKNQLIVQLRTLPDSYGSLHTTGQAGLINGSLKLNYKWKSFAQVCLDGQGSQSLGASTKLLCRIERKPKNLHLIKQDYTPTSGLYEDFIRVP